MPRDNIAEKRELQGNYHIVLHPKWVPNARLIVETKVGELSWASLFRDVGLCKSSSEARDLIKQGGLSVDNRHLRNPNSTLLWGERLMTVDGTTQIRHDHYYGESELGILMRRGKKRHRRMFFEQVGKGAL